MNKIKLETKTVEHCLKNHGFALDAYQINLEHIVEETWYAIQNVASPNSEVAEWYHQIKELQKEYDEYTPETNINNPQDYLDDIEALKKRIEEAKDISIKKISLQRIKDLVLYTLQIKQDHELKRIQDVMLKIDNGDKELHLIILEKLTDLYSFTENDLMKLSSWLTQVKRTAFNKEIKSPTALILYSPMKETGKSTFMTLLKKAILSSYQNDVHLKNYSIERLFSRFKPVELIQDLVISIDEIGWMNKDISAELKSMITDINEIEIEKKFKEPIYSRKLANFIITSNDDPADLFFTDAHERRLSVIDNFNKLKNISEATLYEILVELWTTTPIEYAYDTNIVRDLNLNRIRSNDEIYEACQALYFSYKMDKELIKSNRYTLHHLYEELKGCCYDINKKLLKSYIETSKNFFEKKAYGRITYYYFTDEFLESFDK